jgi:hypothetical protein
MFSSYLLFTPFSVNAGKISLSLRYKILLFSFSKRRIFIQPKHSFYLKIVTCLIFIHTAHCLYLFFTENQHNFITSQKYRAIKLICNRVIHAFESVCRYLNYTLDLLYKRKIKRQLKSGKFKIRFYCQKIRESSRKIRLFYSIIVTINAENVLHVVQSTNEPFV